MNWKNVAHLVSVERKSGRLLRGQTLTRYRESMLGAYLFYLIALGLGLLIGFLVGNFYRNEIVLTDPGLAAQLQPLVFSVLFSLPTIVLIFSLVFTMLSQIQRSGIKATSQMPYWLPITWQEHTLASVLANMIGFPLISIVGITAGTIVFASFAGFVVPAVLSSLAMVAASFMASATTEIFRILQVRFTGAVYKSTGRAAIWVRFAGSLILLLLFYIGYFAVIYGSGGVAFIQVIASTQNAAWFVPFVWLGIMLYNFTSGLPLLGLLFMALSLLFIASLFYLGVWLNMRFGLYEPPAITVTRGAYTPKTGLLGKLGFSTSEAALIRKDLRAFTRRRELMAIFIGPIAIVLVPLMQSLGGASQNVPSQISWLWAALTFVLPSSMMAMILGNLMIGEEGQAVWRIYAAPFSPEGLVKSKYFFILLFAFTILAITGTAGALLYKMSLRATVIALLETIFLVFAIGAVSLSSGIKGADFNELPRPRMIRIEWSFLNLFLCTITGLLVIAPVGFYLFAGFVATWTPGISIDPAIAVAISGVLAAIFTVAFYRISIGHANGLLKKAEL